MCALLCHPCLKPKPNIKSTPPIRTIRSIVKILSAVVQFVELMCTTLAPWKCGHKNLFLSPGLKLFHCCTAANKHVNKHNLCKNFWWAIKKKIRWSIFTRLCRRHFPLHAQPYQQDTYHWKPTKLHNMSCLATKMALPSFMNHCTLIYFLKYILSAVTKANIYLKGPLTKTSFQMKNCYLRTILSLILDIH